jgi:acyl CoA:acetate/3-ketoacid CoA transferase beta subunit
VTNLALLKIAQEGFVLKELAPGVSVDDVRSATGAPLSIAPDLKTMDF